MIHSFNIAYYITVRTQELSVNVIQLKYEYNNWY